MTIVWNTSSHGAEPSSSIDVTDHFERACAGGDGVVTVYATRPDVVRYPDELRALGALPPSALSGGREPVVEGSIIGEDCVRCPRCMTKGRTFITEHEVAVIICGSCRTYVWVEWKDGAR